jgi:hypothetical protein
MAQTLHESNPVNIFDALIIYFACGAPFGVYQFLQYPEKGTFTKRWIEIVSSFVFWPVSAMTIVRRAQVFSKGPETHFDGSYELDAGVEERVFEIQKDLEKIFFDGEQGASIYEFREVFDRYTGLSLALKAGSRPPAAEGPELFRITGHKNIELASICINRRNRSRLLVHQIQAREDFSKLLLSLADLASKWKAPAELASELAALLDDAGAKHRFEKIFAGTSQIEGQVRVREAGRDLWKPAIHKPLPAKHLSVNLRPAPAAAVSPAED